MDLIVKHNRATNSHENEQFRRVASSLKALFKEQGWDGILIGNPYNDNYPRFRADAVLLYNHGLMIIDFKSSSGTIVLPSDTESLTNAPWQILSEKDKQPIVVKAVNQFINFFKQLSYYRIAFKEIVNTEGFLKRLIEASNTKIV